VSDVYHFSLDRARVLLLAGCFAAAAILLFFAGSISGMLFSGGRAAASRTSQLKPVMKPAQSLGSAAQKPPAEPTPASASGSSTNASAQTPQPLAVAAGTAVAAASAPIATAPATPAAIPAAQPASASVEAKPPQPAVASPRPVEASYAIPLAVRVGSFAVKSNAEALMVSLEDMGYRPAMSRYSDESGRQWYVVTLGPYTRWNAASRVAARVSIAENVKPVIGPMQ
jgi:cell division septation protein DedD